MRLVSIEQAAQHLRIDFDGDNDLVLKIQGASSRVLGYIDGGLKRYQDPLTGDFLPDQIDDDGNWKAPADVQAAVLLLLGYLYRQRDEDGSAEFDDGQLPRPVRALLATYRKTVIA